MNEKKSIFTLMEIKTLALVDNCYDCDCGDGCDGYDNDCVSCDSCDCDTSND